MIKTIYISAIILGVLIALNWSNIMASEARYSANQCAIYGKQPDCVTPLVAK